MFLSTLVALGIVISKNGAVVRITSFDYSDQNSTENKFIL